MYSYCNSRRTQLQKCYKYVIYQAAEFAVVSELMSFIELTCAKQNGKELLSIKLKLKTALCVPFWLHTPHTAQVVFSTVEW